MASVRDWRRDRASKSCVDEGFVCRGGKGWRGTGGLCFLGSAEEGEEFFEGKEGQGLGFKEGASCGGLRGSNTRVCEIRYCWHIGSWNNNEYARASITGQSRSETVNGLSVGAQDAGCRLQMHVKSLSPSWYFQCQYLGACGRSSPQQNGHRPLQSLLNYNFNQHKMEASILPAKDFKGEKEPRRKIKGRHHHFHWEASPVADFTKILGRIHCQRRSMTIPPDIEKKGLHTLRHSHRTFPCHAPSQNTLEKKES